MSHRHGLDGVAPQLADDVWIAPGAQVIGRVSLGAGASVWFNAVLRGDNDPITVGPGTNIQDLAMLHTDLGAPLEIGAGCTIGHGVILHGCRIGAGSLIGMGSIVLNGAEVAAGSLIGAGSLVTEGKVIPAGVLALGRPARVVRALTEAEKAGLAASSAGYQARARQYRAGLRPAG